MSEHYCLKKYINMVRLLNYINISVAEVTGSCLTRLEHDLEGDFVSIFPDTILAFLRENWGLGGREGNKFN
jgi:hypothetical protein